MNWFTNALAKLRSRGSASQVENRFRAADYYNPDRTQLTGRPRDIHYDLRNATRSQLVLWSREMEQNNGIYQKLCDLFEQYTVGARGLQFIPSSSDQQWNEKARAWWVQWETVCDLVTLQSFATIQSLVARMWFVDGEVFIVKTYGRDVDGVKRPRIQLVESHRVRSPDKMPDGKTIVDGIELNLIGRPVAYWIEEGFEKTELVRIPAQFVVHVVEPSRVNQLRGIPLCHAVLNDLIDLQDLQRFEMLKAKENARTAKVVKTKDGSVPVTEFRSKRFSETTTLASGSSTTESRVRHLDKALGGEVIALYPEETYEEHRSETPSAGTQYHWDYLLSKICAGIGISKLLVFPYGMQGTVVRADLDSSAAFFRSRSESIANALLHVWRWVMSEAIYSDVNLASAPEDWRRVSVRPPRTPNVDVGRNSQALLSELGAGIRTFEDVCSEMGFDWRERLRQKAAEAAYVKALCKEFDIDASQISSVLVDKPERIATEKPMTANPETVDATETDSTSTDATMKPEETNDDESNS